MIEIIAATSNEGKLRELRAIFKEYHIISQKEAGFYGEIEENGKTFLENAILKAKGVSDALSCIALADDSGLCVDALNGAPGVYSARYAGGHGDDKANNALLLKNLQGKKRTAHFHSAVALVFPDGRIFSGEGDTYGEIMMQEEGENGFGYDPLFFSTELHQSFGVASAEAKNAVSHRYRALMDLVEKVRGIL